MLEAVLDQWAGVPIEALEPSAHHPAELPEGAAIDESRLADLRELTAPNGTSLLETMISSFVERSVDRLVVLRRAAEQDDRKLLAGVTHELKGASGTIGAVRVADRCRDLESVIRDGRAVELTEIDDLAEELDRATTALQSIAG